MGFGWILIWAWTLASFLWFVRLRVCYRFSVSGDFGALEREGGSDPVGVNWQ